MALAMAGVVVAAAAAQQAPDDALKPPPHGTLTIWVLRTMPQSAKAVPFVAGVRPLAPMDYSEQTSGSFGQSASSYGTASSNVGVSTTSAAIAAPPAETGYHEQTSGSFGTESSNVGTESSSYGESLSGARNSAGAGGAATGSSTAATGSSTAAAPVHSYGLEVLAGSFAEWMRSGTRLHWVDVNGDELKERLLAARGTAQFPDVLLGDPSLPSVWADELQKSFGVTLAATPHQYADGVSYPLKTEWPFALLRDAPHPRQARAFVLWMSDQTACPGCVLELDDSDRQLRGAVEAARAATASLASGGGLGSLADPEAVKISALAGSALALPAGADGSFRVPEGVGLRVDAVTANRMGPLAVVTMRVIASGAKYFGVTHPLVVLRRQPDGRWLVLHVSLNPPAWAQVAEAKTLEDAARLTPVRGEEFKGISQASPPDGDRRNAQPDLWWDNGGGSNAQIVEWQAMNGVADQDSAWNVETRLFLVPDRENRVQTRVKASFAQMPATYRWRVWSVGGDGRLLLSSWKTFVVD
jgi:hypothetical protein